MEISVATDPEVKLTIISAVRPTVWRCAAQLLSMLSTPLKVKD
jgi:hypothetical protein